MSKLFNSAKVWWVKGGKYSYVVEHLIRSLSK